MYGVYIYIYICVCVCVCVYVCMYEYVLVHMSAYVWYVYMFACCMYVCMYVFMFSFIAFRRNINYLSSKLLIWENQDIKHKKKLPDMVYINQF